MTLFHETMEEILTTYGKLVESDDPEEAKKAGAEALAKYEEHKNSAEDLYKDIVEMGQVVTTFIRMEHGLKAYLTAKAGKPPISVYRNKSITEAVPELRNIIRRLRVLANKISVDERLAE